MDLPDNAPVKYSESIQIDAPVETVWRLLSDIEKWPTWNIDVQKVKFKGKLEPGATFEWKVKQGWIESYLQAVEPPRVIGWGGKMNGIYAVHIWRISGTDGNVTVTTEESWDGILPRLMKSYGRRALAKSIGGSLLLLKHTAER